MTLAAAQVVDAVAARLVNATTAGARVYTSRLWPLTEADLPAWLVTPADESVDTQMLEDHALAVDAAAHVRANADIDDAMHALAEAGLTALFAQPSIYQMRLEAITREVAQRGEQSVGVVRLRLSTRFSTAPGAPGTILL